MNIEWNRVDIRDFDDVNVTSDNWEPAYLYRGGIGVH